MRPAFSPDGRWIAYASNESSAFEVYVRPFPGPGGRWQVSSGGGNHPKWVANAHQLVYLTPTREVMRVEYSATADSFTPGRSHLWTDVQVAEGGPNEVFDISPNGKHLAGILPVADERRLSEVMFLVNLFDEVKRRVK